MMARSSTHPQACPHRPHRDPHFEPFDSDRLHRMLRMPPAYVQKHTVRNAHSVKDAERRFTSRCACAADARSDSLTRNPKP